LPWQPNLGKNKPKLHKFRENLQRSTSCSEDPDAGTSAPPSIVLRRSVERLEFESVENVSELMSSCEVEEDRGRSVFVRAAAEVLDRHHDFSEKSLLRFLAESFPEIERNQRLPLLIGAFSGAQFVSRMHFFAVHYSRSDDPRRRAARNADAALSNWNLGLRNGTRPTLLMQNSSEVLEATDVQVTSSTMGVSAPPSSSSPKSLQRKNFHLPVEFEQAVSDFPSSRWEATITSESQAAEREGKYIDGASDGSNRRQTLYEGWSAQAPPSLSGQAQGQRNGMDGHISRLGSSGQTLPVLSGQAQGHRDGTGGQTSHVGSSGQILPVLSGHAQGQRNGMDGHISRLGSSGQTPPVLSGQAHGQRDGTGGQASHQGWSGQTPPVLSGQAQGQRDGTGGQASHQGSSGLALPGSSGQSLRTSGKGTSAQAPLECSSRQATAIIAIRSTPSPEWSTQALPVGSSRPPSRVGQSEARRSPSPYSPRGAGSTSSTVLYRPTPKEKLHPRDASTPDDTPPCSQRGVSPRVHSSLRLTAVKRRRDSAARRSSASQGRCNKRRPSDDRHSGVRHDSPSWRGNSKQDGRPAFCHR